MISSLLASVIIAAFPFYLLALLKVKGSIGLIFSFFLEDFLKAFLVLCFYRELAVKTFSKDVDLLD
jgi:Na+-driven multidrug efflux pump